MIWHLSWRADQAARPLADRHYPRRKPGAKQFVPPGRCLVLVTLCRRAYWVTSWPEYVRHDWPGAWICSAFRSEKSEDGVTAGLSSDLIRQAVAATVWWAGRNPLGMVTFVNERKVRHKRDPGRCFRKAGFGQLRNADGTPVRTRKGKYLVLKLEPADMPEAAAPVGAQLLLEAAA